MKTVFILEDNRNIREVLEILFQNENYHVISSQDTKEFYNTFENSLPDLFLLDVMLPDGSGIDVCNFLKQTSLFCRIPVIIMSAHAEEYATTAQCRADAFISKPFDLDRMLEKVAELI